MSSLRLALKQSLEESAGGALEEGGAVAAAVAAGSPSSPDIRERHDDHAASHSEKRGPGRPRKHGDPPRKRGRPRKHAPTAHAETANGAGDGEEQEFSSENEFYSDEEEEDEMGADEPHHQRHAHPHHLRHDDHQHHSAANKIQSHWKKKNKLASDKTVAKAAGTAQDNDDDDDAEPQPVAVGSSPENMARKKIEKKKTSRNKKGDEDSGYSSGKTKTVPAPDSDVLVWMRNLPVKKARKNVAPGMRVKVRFATKVKREGKAVRKKKWFGGRVSAVSKEGSKIRIKYDDGTAEVTKFPDKDIVVDDTFNGQHQAAVDKFLPPEPPSDEEEEEAQFENSAAAAAAVEPPVAKEPPPAEKELFLAAVKPLPTPVEKVVVDTTGNGEEPSVEKQSAEPRVTLIPTTLPPTTLPPKTLPPKTLPPKTLSPNTVPPKTLPPVESVKPSTEQAETDQGATSPPEGSLKPKKKRGRPPKHRPVVEEGVAEPPPKAQTMDEFASKPAVDDKDTELREAQQSKPSNSTKPFKEAFEETPSKDVENAASPIQSEEPVVAKQPSKLSLTIRIPGRKKEDKSISSPLKAVDGEMTDVAMKVPSEATSVEGAEVSPRGEKVKSPMSKKRAHEENYHETSEPPSKRIHIQIPSAKTAQEPKVSKLSDVLPEPVRVVPASSPSLDESQLKEQDVATEKPTEPEKVSVFAMKAATLDELTTEPVERESSCLASAHLSKKKRKSIEVVEESELPGHPTETESDLSASKPKETEEEPSTAPVLDEAKIFEEEVTANLTHSTNSAFESQELPVAHDSTLEIGPNKPLPPHDWPKELAPVARLGRRAAQQANERIVSRHEVVIQDPFAKKRKKRDKRRDGEGGDDSDDSDDSQWVQCDGCSKWRIIPGNVVATLPKQWYCADNLWDAKRASCDAAEQTPKQVAKEKRKKKRQRHAAVAVEVAAAEGKEAGQFDTGKEALVECSRSPHLEAEVPIKSKQSSPAQQSFERDSFAEVQPKAEKKVSVSGLGKKGKTQSHESLVVAASTAEVERPKTKGRGRPRRVDKPSENTPVRGPGGNRPNEDAENLEWVQCEKCDKWRKLPPHVSADELPDVWYCNMNTWNPSSASCDAAEDKADGLLDTGVFGVSGSSVGKNSYRNLIFGNNGRKANRPISERTRAAESLFASQSDEDAPPSVNYADSSAFVSRSSKFSNTDENDEMSVFELMSHSNLWAELRGVAQPPLVTSGASTVKKPLFYSFDSIPSHKKEALKEMLLDSLASKTLTGYETLLEVQCREWENAPVAWAEIRAYCSYDVVVTALCELVKEGKVVCVQSLGPNWTVKDWNPRYKCAKASNFDSGEQSKPLNAHESSRCMKIAKPWKRARIQ